MCSTLEDQEWPDQCRGRTGQHLVSRDHLYTTWTLGEGSHPQHRSGLLLQIIALLCYQADQGSQALSHCVVGQLYIERVLVNEGTGNRFVITFLLTESSSVSSPITVAVDTLEKIGTDSTMLTRLCFTFIVNCSERMIVLCKWIKEASFFFSNKNWAA